MIRTIISVALSFAAQSVLAEPVIVRSGEHINFSRLVVSLPPEAVWSFNKETKTPVLQIEGWTDGYDISQVFERMPKTRVRAVRSEDAEMTIELACDCDIITEELTNGLLTIDISDPEPSSEPPQTDAENVGPAEDINLADTIKLPDLPDRTSRPRDYSRLIEIAETTSRDGHQEFKHSLQEQMARSSGQGLLVANISDPTDQDETGATDPPVFPIEIARLPVAVDRKRARFTSATEQQFPKQAETEEINVVACYNSSVINITAWGDPEDFSGQIATLRRNLVSEFDVNDNTTALSIARLYLYFSLLPEARNILTQFDISTEESKIVRELTDILEGAEVASETSLAKMMHCTEEAGFWAALATSDGGTLSDSQSENILAVFDTMPSHLKIAVGTLLMDRLRKGGAETIAGIVQNSLLRETDNLPSAYQIAQDSNIPLEERKKSLNRLIEKNNETSPNALATLLEMHNIEEISSKISDIELAGALVMQLRGSPISQRLLDAQIIALAHSGNLDDAVKLYLKNTQNADENLTNTFSDINLRTGTDVQFIAFFWKLQKLGLFEGLETEIQNGYISRLIDMGQPQMAEIAMTATSKITKQPSVEARLLASIGRLEEASSILRAQDIATASDDLARLYLRQGQPERALEVTQRRSEPPSDELAWLTGSWNDLQTETVEAQLIAALEDAPTTNPQDTPMAHAEDVVESSRAARDAISAILARQ